MIADISSYQTVQDWDLVKIPELKGIYIKACEGVNAPDKGFSGKALEALKRNIPIGFYHFATLNSQDVFKDATDEAIFFCNLVKPFKTSLPYALDIEDGEHLKLSSDKFLLYIKTFFSVVEKFYGNNYALYSYTPFLNENLPVNHGLGGIKLWLASYTPKPTIPYGWDKIWLWQRTQRGEIPGIKGYVDLSELLE